MRLILLITLLIISVHGKPSRVSKETCGYSSCPKFDPDAINVHIVPHSHDDVGWLKTVDQYYFQDVLYIISSVVVALKQNPERRFVQVETGFFAKWWEQQNDKVKADTIDLINNGQLEIINGAWSMNDEAAVHYQSTIDQFTHGLRYLEDRLGPCSRPRVGWQIDPFGHSREHASLSAQLGFDSLFFARLDYRDHSERNERQAPDLLWRASSNLGNYSDIFTSALYAHYSAPSGFCFDIVCNDAPIIDDEESPDYNYEARVKDFADHVLKQAANYPTNNILVPMGDDFRYEAALNTYINLDLLIKGFDKFPQTDPYGRPIKVYYSTPSCYTRAVNEYANAYYVKLEIKTDDFMPYADSPNTYWTGYFTSRAASKRFERIGNNLLQVAKQLGVAAKLPFDNENITSLKTSMGIFQHHDAITGTEKQHVTNNYHLVHTKAIQSTLSTLDTVLSTITTDGGVPSLGLTSCLLSNVSYCPETDNEHFTVIAYNPLSREVSSPVSLAANSGTFSIKDPEGLSVPYQMTKPIRDFSFVTEAQPSTSHILEFVASSIPPLGYKIYQIERLPENFSEKPPKASNKIGYDDTYIEIDENTGLLSSVTMNGVTLETNQNFLQYSSKDSSGAYIFVPEGDAEVISDSATVTPISGDVYKGVIQEFTPWLKQIIKIYDYDRSYIEFDWVVGPVDISDGGKEIITRFKTNLATNERFYTDSNGREILERRRNYRETYHYTNEQPQSGNYYPVNSKIVLKDDNVEFTILTDRSEGGSSLNDGEVELMIHRACHHDDGRGVGEPLNETQYDQGIVIRGQHYLVIGPRSTGSKSITAVQRNLAQQILLKPWVFITEQKVDSSVKNLKWSMLKEALPENVQLLSLETWSDNEVLLRLEHILEKDEDPELSKEVTVDLSQLFNSITLESIQEMTLGGNIPLDERERFVWPTLELNGPSINFDIDDYKITLAPMQIRTFRAKISYN